MSSQSCQSILQNCAVENIKSRGIINCAEDEKNDTQWMKSLSTKENIFYGAPPYMPILIENIADYIKLDDFEFDRVKEIQTVGIAFEEEGQEPVLYHSNTDNQISIQLTFECCKSKSLLNNGYQKGVRLLCKLFGRLINFEGKPLLEVHHLCKTDDLEGSLKTLTMVSQIVRQKYHYYVCSQNP